MKIKLISYLKPINVFGNNQYGFKEELSTKDALHGLLDEVYGID